MKVSVVMWSTTPGGKISSLHSWQVFERQVHFRAADGASQLKRKVSFNFKFVTRQVITSQETFREKIFCKIREKSGIFYLSQGKFTLWHHDRVCYTGCHAMR